MHDHSHKAAPGLENELTGVLETEGIPLAHVLEDPDENGTIVLTNGVTLLTDAEGAVIVTALAHNGYRAVPGTAVEEAIYHRTRQTLQRLGYPTAPTLRATTPCASPHGPRSAEGDDARYRHRQLARPSFHEGQAFQHPRRTSPKAWEAGQLRK